MKNHEVVTRKEYIEREAICYQLEKQESIDGQPRAIRRARRIVEDFPSADVVPVVHGRWVWDGGEDMHYFCSLCHYNAYGCTGEILSGDYNYCPNCGARMDGDT